MTRPDWCDEKTWQSAYRIVDDLDPVFADSPVPISAVARALIVARAEGMEEAAEMAEKGYWTAVTGDQVRGIWSSYSQSKAEWRGEFHDGPALAQAIRNRKPKVE